MSQSDQQDNIAKAKMLLATRRFIKLDEWLLLQMRSWQNQTAANSDYGLMLHLGTLFDSTETQADNRLELLSDWCQQCPKSYHAQVLLGMYWHEQAWIIRHGQGAEQIEDHQWLGAQLCCDYAVLAFLQAIELHPRPTHALRHMMNLSGSFGEPYWLRALFAGVLPKPMHKQFDIEHSEVWQKGVAHLHDLGVEPASHWPQSLPIILQNTRLDNEDALSYWLRIAMSIRHSDVGTMESYLTFHSSYWGGSEQQQNQIIDGPLCAEFSEEERNHFRANAMLDALSGEIVDRDSPQALELQQRLNHLLAQSLNDSVRIRLLDLAGTCIAYWQDDDQAGLGIYAELFKVSPSAMPSHFSALFISRAVLTGGTQENIAVLTSLLTRATHQLNDPTLIAFAATALNFGLYGLPQQPELSQGLMDRACSLLTQSVQAESLSRDLVTLAHDMAINEDLDAAHFLMTEISRRGNAIHSYELFFFYRNTWHQDVPEYLHNDSNAMDCVLSAARSGLVPAMFTCANALREGIGGEVDYTQAMYWYQQAINAGHPSAAYWRASCALDNGSVSDQSLAVEQWLPEILLNPLHPDRAEAAYTLGMAWLLGIGTKKNRYVASQFMELSLQLNPLSDAAQQVIAELNDSLRARMALWQDKRKVNGENITAVYRQISDLEPSVLADENVEFNEDTEINASAELNESSVFDESEELNQSKELNERKKIKTHSAS